MRTAFGWLADISRQNSRAGPFRWQTAGRANEQRVTLQAHLQAHSLQPVERVTHIMQLVPSLQQLCLELRRWSLAGTDSGARLATNCDMCSTRVD